MMHQSHLRDDLADAKFVLFGRLENAQMEPGQGCTELVITKVVKSDQAIAGKTRVVIPRYLEVKNPNNPPQILVLGDVEKGQFDFYRGVFATPQLADYASGLIKLDKKRPTDVLRYCFDFLEHSDIEISNDAHGEFNRALDADVEKIARTLPAEKLRQWLQNEKTNLGHARLLSFLLGHCGNANDAVLVRELTEKWVKYEYSIDRALAGYVMLDPKPGWAYVCDLSKNKSKPFLVRFSSLRAAIYLKERQPGIVPEKRVLDLLRTFLDQEYFADLAIEPLRKWACWDLTDAILSLYDQKSHDFPIIKRSIVRYALQCPDAKAKTFIADLRKTDASFVKEAEELLDLEKVP